MRKRRRERFVPLTHAASPRDLLGIFHVGMMYKQDLELIVQKS